MQFAYYVVSEIISENLSFHQRKNFLHDVTQYFWDEPHLFRMCTNNIIRQCIPEVDMLGILEACHTSPVGGHHTGDCTARKVLQSGYYRPTLFKDTCEFVRKCDQCQRQRQGSISKQHEMPMAKKLEVKQFDVRGIDFIGSFVSSYGLKYILVVDYVYKWVKVVALTR